MCHCFAEAVRGGTPQSLLALRQAVAHCGEKCRPGSMPGRDQRRQPANPTQPARVSSAGGDPVQTVVRPFNEPTRVTPCGPPRSGARAAALRCARRRTATASPSRRAGGASRRPRPTAAGGSGPRPASAGRSAPAPGFARPAASGRSPRPSGSAAGGSRPAASWLSDSLGSISTIDV